MELDGSVKLFRRSAVVDPYTRGRPATVPGSWESAATSVLEGAWVDEVSVSPIGGDDRVGSLTSATLRVEAGADVRKGDGISRDPMALEPEFVIELVPFTPRNPFTGYAPLLEVPLRGARG